MTACFNNPECGADLKASLLGILKRWVRANKDLGLLHEATLTMLALRAADKQSESSMAKSAIFLFRELSFHADNKMRDHILLVSRTWLGTLPAAR